MDIEATDLELLVREGSDSELAGFLRLLHPADIADLVEQVDEEGRERIFSLLPDKTAAEVLPEIQDYVMGDVLEFLPDERIADFVPEMDTDDAADLLAELPSSQQRMILARIEPSDSEELRRLMEYQPDTAGGLMQTELIAVVKDATVGEVIDEIRKNRNEVDRLHFVFVVDEYKRLEGVLDLQDLILADSDRRVSELMSPEVISVRVDTDQEEVVSLIMKYSLISIPVVDDQNRLLGRIWVDDVMGALEDEVDEDFLLMAGAGEEELEDLSVRKSVVARLPWLIITWIGGITAALIMGHFGKTMSEAMVVLSAFIPIIMAMGGNVGTQSATIIVRGIATGRIDYGGLTHFFFSQLGIGFFLGALIGALTAAFAHIRPSTYEYSLIIGLAMAAVISFSALVGAFLPMFFKKIGVDPAIATAPIISMTCDIVGILIYLTLASFLIS
ncbi:MAG: magnesium transporter [bacterium]